MRHLQTLLFLGCLALGATAQAYKFITPTGGSTSDPARGERWRVPANGIPWMLDSDATPNVGPGTTSAQVRQSSIDGFAKWSAAAPAVVMAAPVTLSANQRSANNDGMNKHYWVERGEGWQFGSGTLGVTTPWAGYDAIIVDADIQYNASDWKWQQGTGSYVPCQTCLDGASIALHEQGHFLGMAHSCETSEIEQGRCANQYLAAVMAAYYDGTSRNNLAADDIAGIQALYNSVGTGGGSTTSPSLCSSCTSDASCASGGQCIAEASGATSGYCTVPCDASNACPVGASCFWLDQAQTRSGCYPTGQTCIGYSGGGTTGGGTTGTATEGQSCNGSTINCATGLVCAGSSAADARCYRTCNPSGASTCGSGERCAAVSASEGVCIAGTTGGGGTGGNLPGEGQACTGQCQAGLVCAGTSQADAKCYRTCTPGVAGQCSSGQTCIATQGGGGVCYGGSGGGTDGGTDGGTSASGELCEPCTNDSACGAGGYCLGESGSTQGRCTVPCGSNGACPSGAECFWLDQNQTKSGCFPSTQTCNGWGETGGTDAGTTTPDAGTGGTDAGTSTGGADAGTGITGGTVTQPGSCGCQSGGSEGMLLSMAGLASALLRRRRR